MILSAGNLVQLWIAITTSTSMPAAAVGEWRTSESQLQRLLDVDRRPHHEPNTQYPIDRMHQQNKLQEFDLYHNTQYLR